MAKYNLCSNHQFSLSCIIFGCWRKNEKQLGQGSSYHPPHSNGPYRQCETQGQDGLIFRIVIVRQTTQLINHGKVLYLQLDLDDDDDDGTIRLGNSYWIK